MAGLSCAVRSDHGFAGRILEAVQTRGIVHQNASAHVLIRHPVGQEIEKIGRVRHRPLDENVRPIARPHYPVRARRHELRHKRLELGIGRRLLGQAVAARQFHPVALSYQAQHSLEYRLIETVARLEHADVVDNGGASEFLEARRDVQQLPALGEQLNVPAELLGPLSPPLKVGKGEPARMRDDVA